MGIHDGHRQRMKTRFLEYGLDNFDDVNALELLLFYALPRQDTNELAHRLMDRFGSLSAVLEAPARDLMAVDGVGESAAALLRLLPELSRRYIMGKTDHADPIDTPAAAGRFFIPRFLYETEEVVMALLLDARKRPLLCRVLSRGVVDAAEISARKLAQLCMERRASGVILAHNHLSGVALPSAEDETTTAALSKAMELLGVELCDHVIVAGCEYVSMRESGLIR